MANKPKLRAVTAVDLRLKMDALVSDLNNALEESQLPQYHRKRRGFKRRTKVNSNLCMSYRLSGDSSSSLDGELLLSQDNKSSIPLSDSDDMSPPPEHRHRTHLLTRMPASGPLVESDSLNENFSPARSHNRSVNPYLCRKRKCKRLALDPDMPVESSINALNSSALSGKPTSQFGPSTSVPSSISTSIAISQKKKLLRPSPDSENRLVGISAGKRKRGRERSADWCSVQSSCRGENSSLFRRSLRCQSHQKSSTENCMEFEYSDETSMEHSTSGSSSGSEAGIYTCDEGREADDEQSDWFAEPDPVYGVPGFSNALGRQRSLVNPRMAWWTDNELGLSSSAKRREIRAGRRRLRDRKPGFSIMSSVNDKVSRFLQDPTQMELRLKPMTAPDRDQLNHLAKLYSLSVRAGDDHTAPILTKTRNTITRKRMEMEGGEIAMTLFPGLPVPLSDLKRRRRTPPLSQYTLAEGSNDSVDSILNSPGFSGTSLSRPPVPMASWEDDTGDGCADSLSERLADSEPDPVPSPTSLGLQECTL